VRFELRNVTANYPFERSHRFAGIQPKYGDRDCSRLSCAAGEMLLGPRAAGVFSKRCAPMLAIERHRCKAQIAAISSDPKPATPLLTLRWTLSAKRACVVVGGHRA
jgi:hypothetical protein